MNIFRLDNDPRRAAEYQCDAHVVKMIIETGQLLSTAHHVLGTERLGMYQATHANHPCSVWVRESGANYLWALQLWYALLEEHRWRWDRLLYHKAARMRRTLDRLPGALSPLDDPTPPPLCMPDDSKISDCPVRCYRQYYALHKAGTMPRFRYTRRAIPEWLPAQPW